MDDKELLKNIINGDNKAFRLLVDKYQNLVFSTCMGFLHSKTNADDVSQEVFIEVYKKASNFRSEAKLSTWLYRIAVNKSLNYIRDNKRNSLLKHIDSLFNHNGDEHKIEIIDHSKNPEEILENDENALALKIAIDSLSKNQKIAFTLHKFDDLSYKEIAEVMDLSLSSVESLIHRSKKNLQKKLLQTFKNLE